MKRLLIFFSILGWLLLFLCSCEKDTTEPQTQPKNKVQYYVNTDSCFLRYNCEDTYFKYPIYTHFDTTFYTDGGWEIIIDIGMADFPMNAGVIINGVTVVCCSNQVDFNVRYYLE